MSRALLFALCLLAAGLTGSLGVWQLGRLADRRAYNQQALADASRRPVDLNVESLERPVTYRSVAAHGEYDLERQLIIRGRLLRGTPGVQVVTPMKLAGRDTVLLVNRGFVPTADAGAPSSPDRFRETGVISFAGVAMDIPDQGDGQPLATASGETWRRLDLSALRRRLPYPIWPYVAIVVADTLSTRDHTIKGRVLPIRIEPPPLDDGPHLSYAVQWFLIGGAALGFGVIFVRGAGRRAVSAPPIAPAAD